MGEKRNDGSGSRPDIVCLEGNGTRPSHKGIGFHEGGVMYTLNATEIHCVCHEEIFEYRVPSDGLKDKTS